ncbi:MAG TPA: phospho-sugar mutase [Spirochaetota bacterium]|nr:phospho-sugar mutase [Spirochaetota bacterium]HOM09320.1 phospho-sugar mutase [Spirochaetota bacterium]HPP50009.1 phospho-sugar mutase [Spirochaetota bacterium]
MDITIQKRIEQWQNPPFDTSTIQEIKQLVAQNNEKELYERFYTTLEFGTGGLRGIIGAGTNRMNIYTVGMATQGLANYIVHQGNAAKGVVIAYDSRRMSDVFSKEAASILAGNGIKVYLFKDIMPTPICSFAIRHYNATAGIVITASHNPPEYNGYKVYWEDGGQVVPPQDKEIIREVSKIQDITQIKKMNFDEAIAHGIILLVGDEIIESYAQKLSQVRFKSDELSPIHIVYTPLHGTGYRIVPQILKTSGFPNVHIVEQQAIPDGNFPTVKSPNPEEPEALTQAIELAQQINADIVLATDPDADRMGVAFKDDNGQYMLINGNQIGSMLLYYILLRLQQLNKLPKNGFVVKTIVTTDLQQEIARHFNVTIENVLTGFKWIAKKMKDYEKSHVFIFGGEESYGYLPLDFVRDKDAVSSCYFFAEMAHWLHSHNKTLKDFLYEIYTQFGYYNEKLVSLTLKGVEGIQKIESIMKHFRSNPPKQLAGTTVTAILDVKQGTLTDVMSGTTKAVDLPASDVLQFTLENGSKVTMRPSGTEPKIKFYFSSRKKGTDIKQLEEEVSRYNETLAKELLSTIESVIT